MTGIHLKIDNVCLNNWGQLSILHRVKAVK
jgi:hypothetical protein